MRDRRTIAPGADVVTLRIRGKDFTGWEEVSVTRSMESVAGSFELSVSERSAGLTRPIRPMDPCELYLGADRVITGYVDDVVVQYGSADHTVRVRGRDRMGDLVDCAPDPDPGYWSDVSLFQLVAQLAAPFGIAVRARVPMGPNFTFVMLNPGQRAFDLIDQQCRMRQVLPVSDGLGTLELTRAGVERVPYVIAEGVNLLSGNANYSARDRFSDYYVKGQGAYGGHPSATARDSELKQRSRFRPLLVVAEPDMDDDKCRERASWELLTRAARAVQIQVRVVGWRHPGGDLWRINRLSRVESDALGVHGELLVTTVTFDRGPGGTTTELELTRPDAYRPAPVVILDPPTPIGFTPAEVDNVSYEVEAEADPGLGFTPADGDQ